MSQKLKTTKRKRVATIVEVSKRVTSGDGAIESAQTKLGRKVIRGEGKSPKVATLLAKKGSKESK